MMSIQRPVRRLLAGRKATYRPFRRSISDKFGHNFHEDMLAGQNDEKQTIVSSYDENGFVVNDMYYQGSVLLFPKAALLWKPQSVSEIQPQSFTAVELSNPITELLILGTGHKIRHDFDLSMIEQLKKKGVVVEVMDSINAVATFNILSAEDRLVSAALLPYRKEI